MGTPYKMKGSPMQRNFGVGSPLHNDQEELTKLVDKRTKLRKKEENLNDGKTKIFGNVRRKINKNKQGKNQAKINANTTAQKNATKGANKKKIDAVTNWRPGPESNPPKMNIEKLLEKKKPQGRRQS
jgi:hypothetical protein